ncbi:MAG TPA: hemerythrin domain-containing protein [Prolixibacteraceae bacterium]|nr:hemerythrin domain-containing protein [Prolixibacteraceae bacterium]
MDRATQNLENDHQHILKLIAVMEEMVKLPEPNTDDLSEVVTIIRQFADGLHHAKEENLLFPLMAEKGFSPEQGPIAVMLMDHEQGRGYVRNIAENIQRYKDGRKDSLVQVYSNMLGYSELLTSHIAKENNVLFRMADNVFTTENQQFLLDQFLAIDAGSDRGIPGSDYIRRIEILAGQYLRTK